MEQNEPINVLDPKGQLVSIPKSQLNDALFNGFKEASSQDEQNYLNEQEYGTTGQQLLTGAESAARTATFGLSDLAENALADIGVESLSPEKRNIRQEVNPGAKLVGEFAGLAVPGASTLMRELGAGASALLGLGGESAGAISRIGSSAVKGAVETALYQSGNEVSKMLSNQADPSTFVETAIPEIALSGLIGGVFGGGLGILGEGIQKISPIKKAVQDITDKEIETTLGSINSAVHESVDKEAQILSGNITSPVTEASIEAGGNETRAELLKYGATDQGIKNAIQISRMTDGIPQELQSGMGQNPDQRFRFQILRESPSQSGIYLKDSLNKFYDKAGDNVIESLGKTPKEAMALAEMSENKIGKSMMSQLEKTLKEKFQGISERYDEWFNKAAKVDITPEIRAQLNDNLGLVGLESGASKLPGTKSAGLIDWVQSVLPKQTTLEDLSKLRSEIRAQASANPQELKYVGGQLQSAIRSAEENLISHGYRSGLVKGSLDEFRQIQAEYGPIRGLLDDLNDRLKLKKWSGVKTFIDSLKEITPETFLNRITKEGDAGFINEVLPNFPELKETIKDYHLNDLIKDAVLKAKRSEDFNLNYLFKNIDNLSPEMKSFILPEESLQRINATRYLLDSIPEKLNNSGTAITLMGLLKKHGASSAIGLTSLLSGGGAAASAIVTAIADKIGKEAPDAIKLGLLKYLGEGQVDVPGFKNMIESIKNTIKGESLIGKAVKGIFDSSKVILPAHIIPDEKKRESLDKKLSEYQMMPEKLLNISQKGSSYLPSANISNGQIAANAVNMLNSMRPGNAKNSPLDPDIPLTPMQKASFDRTLDFAEQPLLILQHLKDGTLQTSDMQLVKTLYPSLYSNIAQKLTNELIYHTADKNPIPYKTQIGLSKFMGQPMVSNLGPQALIQIQKSFMPKQPDQPMRKGHSGSLKNIDNISKLEGTDRQRKSISRWD